MWYRRMDDRTDGSPFLSHCSLVRLVPAPSGAFCSEPGNSFPGALAHGDSDGAITLFGDIPHLKTNVHYPPALSHSSDNSWMHPCRGKHPRVVRERRRANEFAPKGGKAATKPAAQVGTIAVPASSQSAQADVVARRPPGAVSTQYHSDKEKRKGAQEKKRGGVHLISISQRS